MSDLFVTAGFAALLFVSLAGVAWLRSLGVPSTYLRDLLHVGAAVFVLGWPLFDDVTGPAILTLAALALTTTVALAGERAGRLSKLRAAVAEGEERWSGVVLFTAVYAALTLAGFLLDTFAAAAALLALSLGDGLGGAAGRRFGRVRYRAPRGKRKSLEGSLVVALASMAAVALAGWHFSVDVSASVVIALGLLAAIVEALAPRGSDNLLLPASVYACATALRALGEVPS